MSNELRVFGNQIDLLNRLESIKVSSIEGVENALLQGSFSRTEPFDDIDLYLIGDFKENGTPELPKEVDGVSISYRFIEDSELDDFFLRSFRATPAILDSLIINAEMDSRLGRALHDAKELMRRPEKSYDFFLYCCLDRKIAERDIVFGKLQGDSYFARKNHPGGKRTIMRMIHMYKILLQFPQTQETQENLERLVKKDFMSQEVSDAITNVFALTHTNNQKDFLAYTDIVSEYFSHECAPFFLELSKPKEPQEQLNSITDIGFKKQEFGMLKLAFNFIQPEYHNLLHDITEPQPSKGSISQAITMVAETEQLFPWQRWNLLYFASSSEAITESETQDVLSYVKGNFSYETIVKNLIKNPSVPTELLCNIDLDAHNQYLLNRKNSQALLRVDTEY